MRFSVEGSGFDTIGEALADQTERAVKRAMTRVTAGVKNDLREQVTGAGLGQRLANTWQGKTFPERGGSIDAAAFVFSKAAKLALAFDEGSLITARNAKWLAIPTAAAGPVGGRGTSKRLTPAIWEQRTGQKLRLQMRKGRTPVLVIDRRVSKLGRVQKESASRQATSVIFVLVKQAKLPKLLDIDAVADEWTAAAPILIEDEIGRAE